MPPPTAELPPFFALLSPCAQLSFVEARATPLTPETVHNGLWLRVRADGAAVQRLCEPPAAGADDAPPGARNYVGWNKVRLLRLASVTR